MPVSKDRQQEIDVFLAEAKPGTTNAAASAALVWIHKIGRELHRIYERQCNGHQKPNGDWDEEAAKRDEMREEALEAELRSLFSSFGLGLYLNGDPRGNPVGILTPKTGRYNTMGGAECGWRL